MITLTPIAYVKNARTQVEDDYWGSIVSEIVLDEAFDAESLWGLEDFSHAEIIFYFHQVDASKIVTGAASSQQPRLAEGRHLCAAREESPELSGAVHREDCPARRPIPVRGKAGRD